MKILLISVNTQRAPHPVYPLGLDYVAGSVSPRHQVRILDLVDPDGPATLAGELKNFAPDLVGLSIRNIDTTDVADSRGFVSAYTRLMEEVRSASRAVTVLGGSGFTIFPEALMRVLDADFGIAGDGEWFGPLVEALDRGEDPLQIPGVMTRRSPPVSPACHRDPGRRPFDAHLPHLDFYLKNGGLLNLQTKRGCPFRCLYCTYPLIDGSDLRLSPPDEVARTARQLQDAGAKYLFITDSTFNCSPTHSLDVARAFIKAGITIPWGAFFAPLAPPPDYYRIMTDAGLSHVEFGTESLCDAMLQTYRKPFRTGDIGQAHAEACRAGLHVCHYLLLGGPGEDEKTLSETLRRAEAMPLAVFFFFCGIRIYPSTGLYDIAIREGQIDPSQDLLEPVYYQPETMPIEIIRERVGKGAAGRLNWVIGSGGEAKARVVGRLHRRGHTGPLWEHLIR